MKRRPNWAECDTRYDDTSSTHRTFYQQHTTVRHHSCACPTFLFLNDTAPTELYTLSLHDALPIFRVGIKSNISTNRNNLISGVDRCIHLNAMKKTTITSIN